MTNVQLYLALGIPFLSLVVAMVISNSRINDMRDLLRAEIQTVRAELSEQRRLLDRIITSIDVLTGKVIEIDNRLTRLEERMDNRH